MIVLLFYVNVVRCFVKSLMIKLLSSPFSQEFVVSRKSTKVISYFALLPLLLIILLIYLTSNSQNC